MRQADSHRGAPVGAVVVAAAALIGGGLWWRRYTTPFPYSQRWMLDKELPFLTRERLLAVLTPQPGERILEIGPGTGLFSLPVAAALEPGGSLEVVDVQQEMLDHTLAAAGAAGAANLTASQADVRHLPHDDASFDAAFLITVLGEIPDQPAVLKELRRVLRPGGRLVVGEFLIDWHAVPLALLRRRATAAGFRFECRSGPQLSYLARFRAE